jgi:hypothetical protein
LEALDHLIKENPNNVWIIKRRLILSTMDTKIPLPASFKKRLWHSYPDVALYPQKEITIGLRLSRHGAKMEPNNALFDWMQAYLLFAQNKPKDALKMLGDASHKKYFDDGYHQSFLAYREAIRLTGYDLFEERLMLGRGPILRNFDWIQETNAAAVWQGALAEQEGNHQKALDIYETQMHLYPAILSSPSLNGISITDSVNSLALMDWLSQNRYKAWKNEIPQFPHRHHNHDELMKIRKAYLHHQTIVAAQSFAKYAVAHYRPKTALLAKYLANRFSNEYNTIYTINSLSNQRYKNYYDPFFGKNVVQFISKLKWSGMQLAMSLLKVLIPALIITSLFSALMLRRKDSARQLILEKALPVSIISAAIFALCIFGVFIFMFFQIAGSNFGPNGYQLYGDPITDWSTLIHKYIYAVIFVSCFVYCAIASLWNCRKSTFVAEAQDALFGSLTVKQSHVRNRRMSIFWKIIFWMITFAIQFGWFHLVIPGSFSLVIIPAPLIIALAVWWVLKNPKFPQPIIFTGTYWLVLATWLHRSLAILVLTCTVAYGLSSWVSLPLRNSADKSLNHIVKVGWLTVQQ